MERSTRRSWPGNTNDNAILPEVKDGLRGWRLGRVVTVVDRGFSSDANLASLRRAGGHWIAGERMRDGSPDAQAALARQGRYQTVRDNLRVKEVRLDDTSHKRWIVCHNPMEAERDKTQRDAALARLEAELERIRAASARDAKSNTAKKKTNTQAGHRAAECALRDHPTLGRWLRQLPSGRLVIDRAKITAEQRLDGKYLLSTSDPDLPAEDVALGYKNLLEAERGVFNDSDPTRSGGPAPSSHQIWVSRRCIPGTVTRPPLVPGENPALPEVGSSPVASHEGCSARRWRLRQQ